MKCQLANLIMREFKLYPEVLDIDRPIENYALCDASLRIDHTGLTISKGTTCV